VRRVLLTALLPVLPSAVPTVVLPSPLPGRYRVTVTRLDRDVNRVTTSNLLTVTRICCGLVYSDEPMLHCESYGFRNKLHLPNGQE